MMQKEIFDIFAKSKYGNILNNQLRYEVFKTDDITSELWIEMLGPNANNLEHMQNTYKHTQEILRFSELSDEEKDELYLASLTHDWGESIIGDIDFESKNSSHVEEEKKAFTKIVNELFEDRTQRELLINNFLRVSMDVGSRLGTIFNAIERLGYLSDGMRLAGHIDAGRYKDCHELFGHIINSITKNQTEAIIQYSEDYIFVDSYLKIKHKNLQVFVSQINKNQFPKQRDEWDEFLIN